MAEKLGLKEGSRITMRIEEGKLLVGPAEDAIDLALKGKKFASLTPEEVEKISREAQEIYEGSS
ncbi:MAG: AbrB/MazE/SpoVT family DNA-binding domain-containing protein [Candidatus Freyarchaeota archaeon]